MRADTIGPMRIVDPHPFLNFVTTVRRLLADPAFRAAFATLAALMLVGTLFYSFVEGWNLLDSLYFSVIAAATVGFGDLAPVTGIGKAFTIVYVLISVGLLVLILGSIARGMVDQRVEHLTKETAALKDDGGPADGGPTVQG